MPASRREGLAQSNESYGLQSLPRLRGVSGAPHRPPLPSQSHQENEGRDRDDESARVLSRGYQLLLRDFHTRIRPPRGDSARDFALRLGQHYRASLTRFQSNLFSQIADLQDRLPAMGITGHLVSVPDLDFNDFLRVYQKAVFAAIDRDFQTPLVAEVVGHNPARDQMEGLRAEFPANDPVEIKLGSFHPGGCGDAASLNGQSRSVLDNIAPGTRAGCAPFFSFHLEGTEDEHYARDHSPKNTGWRSPIQDFYMFRVSTSSLPWLWNQW